ncbi:hypothetical protein D1816_18535 [Aquimarina sp. AD10]|uniref:DUF5946 family protein n=1 Tax=Aquimarina sp. AD10 TaxID=1714849 RepID=UPI000E50B9C2|nr:DUF5946 family protein [Aquimarina sp. AD10]AXT62275.1 hypothetical protein D1816_18535 [Aquimarina sp. AD10]RKM90530.1 hypothetical protein D7033_23845 [Aquimarina sp. AD10]
MQNYIYVAKKNGVALLDSGQCQFCGANTKRGIHECLEIFNLGFQEIDFSNRANHIYRFLIVDAHTLQHPEIHGRWNNHFHLSRLHLIFKYDIKWTYAHSPKLSDYLNEYKVHKHDEYLNPPEILKRGNITTIDIKEKSTNEFNCKDLIKKWALEVYEKWSTHHDIVDDIAKGFLKRNKGFYPPN